MTASYDIRTEFFGGQTVEPDRFRTVHISVAATGNNFPWMKSTPLAVFPVSRCPGDYWMKVTPNCTNRWMAVAAFPAICILPPPHGQRVARELEPAHEIF